MDAIAIRAMQHQAGRDSKRAGERFRNLSLEVKPDGSLFIGSRKCDLGDVHATQMLVHVLNFETALGITANHWEKLEDWYWVLQERAESAGSAAWLALANLFRAQRCLIGAFMIRGNLDVAARNAEASIEEALKFREAIDGWLAYEIAEVRSIIAMARPSSVDRPVDNLRAAELSAVKDGLWSQASHARLLMDFHDAPDLAVKSALQFRKARDVR